MSMSVEWKKLYAYHVWANSRMLDNLQTTAAAADVFGQQLAGPFPTMARTFGHIYDVDFNWFSRMSGTSPTSIGQTVFAGPAEANSVLAALHRSIGEYLDGEDGERIIHYRTTTGLACADRLSDLVLHMANHGTYHRGNMTVMLYQAGLKSCPTDYIHFLRENGITGR